MSASTVGGAGSGGFTVAAEALDDAAAMGASPVSVLLAAVDALFSSLLVAASAAAVGTWSSLLGFLKMLMIGSSRYLASVRGFPLNREAM